MDIKDFKANILSVMAEAQSLAGCMSDSDSLKYINDFQDSLSILVEFVEDDRNLTVLNNHCYEKTAKGKEQYPLDGLCKRVLERLEEIDTLLKTELLVNLRSIYSQPNGLTIYHFKIQELNNLTIRLSDKSFLDLLSAFNVLKHLDGHSKTLIILGANGSGKTSLANYLRNLDSHVKIIPASKPIKATGHIPSMYNSSLTNYNNELYDGGVINQDLMQKLIIGMCSEHDNIARKYMDTHTKEKESTYEKVKRIFDDFFDVQLDSSAFEFKVMKAKKEGVPAFDFNNMSDGERVAFFYISTVLAAPDYSFIVVDEPENHLNPAIYNKIWERLIETRKDCQFIFISHTMDFVAARSNFELVKIRNFIYPDRFEFDFLGNTLENIPIELTIEIIGSRKPIIFCEGSKTDLDYKVYDSVFGSKYTIVPTGNCASVERSVEACNMHANTFSIQTAIGIIDSDLKNLEEIERLKKKGVYTLRCNEIEMLLIDEEIFKRALVRIFKSEDLFYSFKNDFFNKLEERKQNIIRRLVKTQIDEKMNNSIIDDKHHKTKEDIKDKGVYVI